MKKIIILCMLILIIGCKNSITGSDEGDWYKKEERADGYYVCEISGHTTRVARQHVSGN